MDVSYLMQVLENKIVGLNNAKSQAFALGDMEQILKIDQELLETENTLKQLRLLQDLNRVALSSNITTQEVVTSALETFQNVPVSVQGPSAAAVIQGYDLSAYATDTLYEGKIQTILDLMPSLADEVATTVYIQDKAPGSPITGDMVFAAAKKYKIDKTVLLAIIQNDSDFGTKGVGASTNNPGNVGNTGAVTRSFSSWEEGVEAVAEWLSLHRVVA